MKRHIDVHHLQKKYKCKDESCKMEFSSESGAKYHYKRYVSARVYIDELPIFRKSANYVQFLVTFMYFIACFTFE